jgi:hypothetical protein
LLCLFKTAKKVLKEPFFQKNCKNLSKSEGIAIKFPLFLPIAFFVPKKGKPVNKNS